MLRRFPGDTSSINPQASHPVTPAGGRSRAGMGPEQERLSGRGGGLRPKNETESEVTGVNNFYLGRKIRPRTIGVTTIYNFNDA